MLVYVLQKQKGQVHIRQRVICLREKKKSNAEQQHKKNEVSIGEILLPFQGKETEQTREMEQFDKERQV